MLNNLMPQQPEQYGPGRRRRSGNLQPPKPVQPQKNLPTDRNDGPQLPKPKKFDEDIIPGAKRPDGTDDGMDNYQPQMNNMGQ